MCPVLSINPSEIRNVKSQSREYFIDSGTSSLKEGDHGLVSISRYLDIGCSYILRTTIKSWSTDEDRVIKCNYPIVLLSIHLKPPLKPQLSLRPDSLHCMKTLSTREHIFVWTVLEDPTSLPLVYPSCWSYSRNIRLTTERKISSPSFVMLVHY